MKGRRDEPGITLMEVLVVLVVLAVLVAVLVPVAFRYIDDAKRGQAQTDLTVIAAAIQQVYKDTGRWPYCKNCTGPLTLQLGDADLLTSNESCNGSGVSTCDSAKPQDGTTDLTWGLTIGATRADSIANHVIKNTPFGGDGTPYATTGPRRWKGAYTPKIPPTDPWGRSYLVNISRADPRMELPNTDTTFGFKWVMAISAGPNGVIETTNYSFAINGPSVGGDDIITRVK